MSYEKLLSPMNIGNVTVKNRTVMTAAEFSLGQPNGKPTEKLMNYYEERAKGGVGLIIPGICRVNDMLGAASYTQLAMSHDCHIEPMREFANRIHSLTDIVRTRFAGRLFAPGFISFFAGRQPSGITQFRLTQKYAPAKSAISECV